MSQDDHVTVQEAAQYLRISIATVYRLLRSAKLTGVKVKPQGAKRKFACIAQSLSLSSATGTRKLLRWERAPSSLMVWSGSPEPKLRHESASTSQNRVT